MIRIGALSTILHILINGNACFGSIDDDSLDFLHQVQNNSQINLRGSYPHNEDDSPLHGRKLIANCLQGLSPGPACSVAALINCVNNANPSEVIEICNSGITFSATDDSIQVTKSLIFRCIGCTDLTNRPATTLSRSTPPNTVDRGRFFNVGNLPQNGAISFIGINFQNARYGTDVPTVRGGAISIRSPLATSIRIIGCAFRNNISTGFGGAVFIEARQAIVLVTQSEFSTNIALNDYGGALAIQTVAQVTLDNSSFFSNEAQGKGAGAVYIQQVRVANGSSGGVTLTQCKFGYYANANLGNKARQSGGAVIISDVEALVTIQLCDFSFNTATTGNQGAVRIKDAGSVAALNNNFYGNRAPLGFTGALDIKDVKNTGTTTVVRQNSFQSNEALAETVRFILSCAPN